MLNAGGRSAARCHAGPGVELGVIAGPGVHKKGSLRKRGWIGGSTPHHHFIAGPDGCMAGSRHRRSVGFDRCPLVASRIVASAVVLGFEGSRFIEAETGTGSAPDDHFVAGPNRRVAGARRRRVDERSGCPATGREIETPAGVKSANLIRGICLAAPNDHLRSGPDRGVVGAAKGVGSRGQPRAGQRIVASTGIEQLSLTSSDTEPAPDYHFITGPNGGERRSR